ncbi:histone-like transcription factor (CBF/NF-Y) [Pseudohyphozyma bogoriensis]|nr:histone-like transcription factor (CBF/NF-Y) [Pseudohyphozyma bogoriensis]
MGKKSTAVARFPVARIKKIIQADEDVAKALELFLASLVGECVKDAQERGSKKITAYGLKRTVTQVATFDFCSDIVAGVADPIGDENGDGDKPKKKRAPRKKKDEGAGGGSGEDEEPKPKRKRTVKPKAEPEADEEERDASADVAAPEAAAPLKAEPVESAPAIKGEEENFDDDEEDEEMDE